MLSLSEGRFPDVVQADRIRPLEICYLLLPMFKIASFSLVSTAERVHRVPG